MLGGGVEVVAVDLPHYDDNNNNDNWALSLNSLTESQLESHLIPFKMILPNSSSSTPDSNNIDDDELEPEDILHNNMHNNTGDLVGKSQFAVFKCKSTWGKYALKVIPYKDHNLQRANVLREMYTLLRCSGSTNVLGLVGWSEDQIQGSIFLAIQFCDGGSLRTWMTADILRPRDLLFSMLRGIVSGLGYIHWVGIIHNDIKPDNILICKGSPMISDFGSATPPGHPIQGTEGYQCPESDLADQKSDTYSLGVTIYQLYSNSIRRFRDPYGMEISPNTIPDSQVREMLSEVLIPKSRRMTVLQIIRDFPQTSTGTFPPTTTPSPHPHQQQHINNNRVEPQPSPVPPRPDAPNSILPSSPGTGPTKLARFPNIQAFWGENFGNTNDAVPMSDFLDDLRLVLPYDLARLLDSDSPDYQVFIQSIADDKKSFETISPRSLGAFLVRFPGIEEDTIPTAVAKAFHSFQSERHQKQKQQQQQQHLPGALLQAQSSYQAQQQHLQMQLQQLHLQLQPPLPLPPVVPQMQRQPTPQPQLPLLARQSTPQPQLPSSLIRQPTPQPHLPSFQHQQQQQQQLPPPHPQQKFMPMTPPDEVAEARLHADAEVARIALELQRIAEMEKAQRKLARDERRRAKEQQNQQQQQQQHGFQQPPLPPSVPLSRQPSQQPSLVQLQSLPSQHPSHQQQLQQLQQQQQQQYQQPQQPQQQQQNQPSSPPQQHQQHQQLQQLQQLQHTARRQRSDSKLAQKVQTYLQSADSTADPHACIKVAGYIAAGVGGVSKDLSKAAAYLSTGLGGGQWTVAVKDLTEETAERWDWEADELKSSKTCPVTVDPATGRVVSFIFNKRDLTGTIPTRLVELRHITHLNLSGNKLGGPIPLELCRLTQLQYLLLHKNQFTGSIPKELGQLTQLLGIALYDNKLTGVIPPEFGQLTQLQGLVLDNNKLSGVIPAEVGQLKQMQRLKLSNNQLEGPIPRELGQLYNLKYLYLQKNQLSGTIPAELGQATQLQYLCLSSNMLSGPIPRELGILTQLQYLWLENNQLSGGIPIELGHLQLLYGLDLRNNQLEGVIPELVKALKCLKDFGGNEKLKKGGSSFGSF